jgi:hypothetical protein
MVEGSDGVVFKVFSAFVLHSDCLSPTDRPHVSAWTPGDHAVPSEDYSRYPPGYADKYREGRSAGLSSGAQKKTYENH